MNTHKDGSVTLSSAEWEELNKAYQGLYDILSSFPTFLGDFFQKREDYKNVCKWSEQLQGREFVDEDEFDEDDEEYEDEEDDE